MVYLDQSGYQGFLISEKEEGDDKAEQLVHGLRFLKALGNIGS
jgi:hypothetical protein